MGPFKSLSQRCFKILEILKILGQVCVRSFMLFLVLLCLLFFSVSFLYRYVLWTLLPDPNEGLNE